MSKTTFSYGTIVTSSFLNKIFKIVGSFNGHVHDGVDDDGHVQPIDIDRHGDGVSPAEISGRMLYENLPLLRMLGLKRGFNQNSYNSGLSWGVTVGTGFAVSANSGILSSVAYNPILLATSQMTKIIINSTGDGWQAWSSGSLGGACPTSAPGWPSIADDIWLHLFVLGSSGNQDVFEFGVDTSIVAVNLRTESGYDFYRRIGSVRIDYIGGGIYRVTPYYSIENRFIWTDDAVDYAVNESGSISFFQGVKIVRIPPDIIVKALLRAQADTTNDVTDYVYLILYDYEQSFVTTGNLFSLSSLNTINSGEYAKLSGISQNVKMEYSSGGNIVAFRIICLGWEEMF